MKKDYFKDSKIKFPAYEPWISIDDKKIINRTLSQSMLTLGPQLEKFESDFCKYSKAKYAVAVSNCTAEYPYASDCTFKSSIIFTISSGTFSPVPQA